VQTIVLDPGHGGGEVGVRGAGGIEEKTVTLGVARRLRGLIESRLGIRVILTRDDDRAVGPDERAAVANNNKADVFLSLHANAAPAPAVAGAEVFHLRLDREGEDARRDAEAEGVSLPVLGGATREIEVIRWDLAQARHVEASGVLAGMLEDELRMRVTMGPRPRQQAPLRVLMGANMPAALVEIAYLTNPDQERVAASEEYQNLVAQALYDAVARFREYVDRRAP
jgi:N-acetylmuramoyl-L-alanine amidase